LGKVSASLDLCIVPSGAVGLAALYNGVVKLSSVRPGPLAAQDVIEVGFH
jgi:hypothetical protein